MQIVGSMGSEWSRCVSVECLYNLHDGDTGASIIAKRGEYEGDGGRALLKCGADRSPRRHKELTNLEILPAKLHKYHLLGSFCCLAIPRASSLWYKGES